MCILGISILFLNSSYCFDQLKGDKNDLESSSSSYSEVMSDTRINNVLLKQLLERVEHVEEENRHLLKLVHHLETENSNRKKEIDELRDEFDLQKEYTNGLEELIVEIGNSKQNVKIPEENKVDKQNTLLNYTKQSPSMTQPLTSSQGNYFCIFKRYNRVKCKQYAQFFLYFVLFTCVY